MYKKLTILPFLLSLFIISCQSQNNNTGTGINETIDINTFETKLKSDNAQLIDVRTPSEFSGGHLKGAKNIDINSGAFETEIKALNKNNPVMVYCLSGGRSAQAADILSAAGFKEVYNMQGGIMKWGNAGKPLDYAESSAAPQETGMSVEDFEKQLQTEKLVLVDYNAKWCKPCIKMLPMLKNLADKKHEKLILIAIDADENKSLLSKKGISAIPYLELYRNGKLIWKHEGEIDEATLLSETNL